MEINNLVLIILSMLVFYILVVKKEKMSNTDIKKMISDIYQADIQSIRNISKLANDLTNNGKLVVPGGLEIKGNVKINGNSEVTKNSTIIGKLNVNDDTNLKKNLVVNKNINAKQDIKADGNGYFGPAYIGKYGKTRSDWAQFSHVKMTGTNQYAVVHHQEGETIINAASGKTLNLSIKDSKKMYIQSNGDIRMVGVLACNNHAHFSNGAHFYGWSGWATKNAQRPYSGYSSSNVYIKGINENGHLYVGTKYGNSRSSKKATV